MDALRWGLMIGVAIGLALAESDGRGEEPKPAPWDFQPHLAQMPGDAAMVVVVRPRQIFSRTKSRGETVAALLQALREDPHSDLNFDFALAVLDSLNVELIDVEDFAFRVDRVSTFRRTRKIPQGDLMLFRFAAPIESRNAVQMLVGAKEIQWGGDGGRYWGLGKDGSQVAMSSPDNRTLIVGAESQVRRYLREIHSFGSLTPALKTVRAEDDLTILTQCEELRELRDSRFLNGVLSILFLNRGVATLAVRFGPAFSCELKIEGREAEDRSSTLATMKSVIKSDVEDFQRAEEASGNPREPGTREREEALKKFCAFLLEATNAISFKAKRGLVEGTLPAEARLAIDVDYTPIFSPNGTPFDFAAAKRIPHYRRVHFKDPLAAEMQRILPVAAAIPRDQFQLGISKSWVYNYGPANQPFSLLLLHESPLNPALGRHFPELAKELSRLKDSTRLADQGLRDPFQLENPSAWFGYCALLRSEHLQKIECQVKDHTLRGVADFEIPDQRRGRFEFSAKKNGENWDIEEFRLPARGITCKQAPDGHWQIDTPTGPWGRQPERRRIQGAVKFDGELAASTRLDLHLQPHGENFEIQTDDIGFFTARLPAGKYLAFHWSQVVSADPTIKSQRIAHQGELEVAKEGKVNVHLKSVAK